MDALAAIVGLLLSAILIGLLLGLWACFREIQGPLPNLTSYSSILSIQPSACLSWASSFLLWRTRSRGWSLEWVCFFGFLLLFSYFYLKLPGGTA